MTQVGPEGDPVAGFFHPDPALLFAIILALLLPA